MLDEQIFRYLDLVRDFYYWLEGSDLVKKSDGQIIGVNEITFYLDPAISIQQHNLK